MTAESSSLEDSGVLVDDPSSSSSDNNNNNNNDMSSSGVLVESPPSDRQQQQQQQQQQRRNIHDTAEVDDAELLQESILDSRQKRLQQLAADQRSKRNSKQQQGRIHPTSNTTKANPFSRFLTAFSVDPQYPHHKRGHEEAASSSHSPEEDDDEYQEKEKAGDYEEPPLKHARTLDKEFEDNNTNENDDPFSKVMNLFSDITETLKENSTSVLAVGAAVASLALVTLIRKK